MRTLAAGLCLYVVAASAASVADPLPPTPDPFQMAPPASVPKPAPRPHPRDEEPIPETAVAPPPPVVDDPSVSKLTRVLENRKAKSGAPTRIGHALHVEGGAQCRTSLPEIRILQQPAHGAISTADESSTIANKFIVGSPGVCAGRPAVTRMTYYQSQPGYKGPDTVTYETLVPNREVVLHIVGISVE